jgi:hypothetical protein
VRPTVGRPMRTSVVLGALSMSLPGIICAFTSSLGASTLARTRSTAEHDRETTTRRVSITCFQRVVMNCCHRGVVQPVGSPPIASACCELAPLSKPTITSSSNAVQGCRRPRRARGSGTCEWVSQHAIPARMVCQGALQINVGKQWRPCSPAWPHTSERSAMRITPCTLQAARARRTCCRCLPRFHPDARRSGARIFRPGGGVPHQRDQRAHRKRFASTV